MAVISVIPQSEGTVCCLPPSEGKLETGFEQKDEGCLQLLMENGTCVVNHKGWAGRSREVIQGSYEGGPSLMGGPFC